MVFTENTPFNWKMCFTKVFNWCHFMVLGNCISFMWFSTDNTKLFQTRFTPVSCNFFFIHSRTGIAKPIIFLAHWLNNYVDRKEFRPFFWFSRRWRPGYKMFAKWTRETHWIFLGFTRGQNVWRQTVVTKRVRTRQIPRSLEWFEANGAHVLYFFCWVQSFRFGGGHFRSNLNRK